MIMNMKIIKNINLIMKMTIIRNVKRNSNYLLLMEINLLDKTNHIVN